MDRGTHARAEVSGAARNVTQVFVICEPCLFFDSGGSDRETFEDLTNVGARLHGDNAELVLLIDPDEERLVVVVEDATSFWPFAFKTTRFKIFVATFEKEVIRNELLAVLISHRGQRVVLALELTIEGLEC